MPKNKHPAFALTSAYIEMLHDQGVSLRWSGTEPIAAGEYRDERLLGSAAGRPFQTAFGEEIYDSIAKKAGALFHSLIANHPFHNGNKRTAVLALDHFLLANGYFLTLTPKRMYELASETATYRERGITHEQMLSRIARMIETMAVPIETLKGRVHLKGLYERAQRVRQNIRRHRLNR